jgi:hypothetical protein
MMCSEYDSVMNILAGMKQRPDRHHAGAPAGTTSTSRAAFRGNKASLPSKPCVVCQRPMSWRRAWAKNWDSVRYCSEACRKKKDQTA